MSHIAAPMQIAAVQITMLAIDNSCNVAEYLREKLPYGLTITYMAPLPHQLGRDKSGFIWRISYLSMKIVRSQF